MMNKPAYSFVDAQILAKDKAEGEEIFVKLNDGQFQNWIVQITNILLNDNSADTYSLRMEYIVLKVPKGIDDKMISARKSELDTLMSLILNDIQKEAISLIG